MTSPIRSFTFDTEAQTEAFARSLSHLSRPGDVFLLEGDIGAGKTSLARAFIRAKCGSETEVPSPTFTLIQTYEYDEGEIWHCDLYRLSSPDEAIELGLDAAFETAITLVEWPDRLAELAPSSALTISLQIAGDGRTACVYGEGDWAERLAVIDG